MQDKVQVRKISEIASRASSTLLDGRIADAFAALSDRDRALGQCLQAARSQRDLPPYSLGDLLVKIRDWARILRSIPEWGLVFCFDRAIASRGEKNKPFEAGEVYRVWTEMAESTKQSLFAEQIKGKALTTDLPCAWCNNLGFVRVLQNGTLLTWKDPQESWGMAKCQHPN